MVLTKNTTGIVIAGIIATFAIGALASISFSTAAFVQGGLNAKSPQCLFGGAGGGDPHDAETQLIHTILNSDLTLEIRVMHVMAVNNM